MAEEEPITAPDDLLRVLREEYDLEEIIWGCGSCPPKEK